MKKFTFLSFLLFATLSCVPSLNAKDKKTSRFSGFSALSKIGMPSFAAFSLGILENQKKKKEFVLNSEQNESSFVSNKRRKRLKNPFQPIVNGFNYLKTDAGMQTVLNTGKGLVQYGVPVATLYILYKTRNGSGDSQVLGEVTALKNSINDLNKKINDLQDANKNGHIALGNKADQILLFQEKFAELGNKAEGLKTKLNEINELVKNGGSIDTKLDVINNLIHAQDLKIAGLQNSLKQVATKNDIKTVVSSQTEYQNKIDKQLQDAREENVQLLKDVKSVTGNLNSQINQQTRAINKAVDRISKITEFPAKSKIGVQIGKIEGELKKDIQNNTYQKCSEEFRTLYISKESNSYNPPSHLSIEYIQRWALAKNENEVVVALFEVSDDRINKYTSRDVQVQWLEKKPTLVTQIAKNLGIKEEKVHVFGYEKGKKPHEFLKNMIESKKP